MKCINCGGEINEGTPFCPLCGAAQTAVEGSENVNNEQQPYGQYQQPPYQPQPSYEPQSQQHYEASQQLPYMQQQTSYGNTTYQWQQSPYIQPQQQYRQPQPSYGQQFNQEYAQNNIQNPIKKKSKAPLIIGIVATILIIAGLAVTGIILLNSLKYSAPEETVEKFMDALLYGDYEEALDYLHPFVIDIYYNGSREKAIEGMEDLGIDIISYDDMSSESSSADVISKYLKEYGYNDEIPDEIDVKIDVELNDGTIHQIHQWEFWVGKINGKCYIFGSLVFLTEEM